jgi:hypothetical protein
MRSIEEYRSLIKRDAAVERIDLARSLDTSGGVLAANVLDLPDGDLAILAWIASHVRPIRPQSLMSVLMLLGGSGFAASAVPAVLALVATLA